MNDLAVSRQAALLLQHCMHREKLFKDIAKMVQYFPWQPSEPLSTQGSDVKGECKVQMRDSSHLVWLWPLNRNSVGRGADTCSTWQKTQLWLCCINLLIFIMVKRRGREGRVLGSRYEFHDHPTSWRTLLVFCICTWVQISHLAHKDYFLCCTSANMYMPTAARTADESHRHSAKQLVQQCSHSHVNKRDESWFPRALSREEYWDSVTLLPWGLHVLSLLGSWHAIHCH